MFGTFCLCSAWIALINNSAQVLTRVHRQCPLPREETSGISSVCASPIISHSPCWHCVALQVVSRKRQQVINAIAQLFGVAPANVSFHLPTKHRLAVVCIGDCVHRAQLPGICYCVLLPGFTGCMLHSLSVRKQAFHFGMESQCTSVRLRLKVSLNGCHDVLI